MLKFNINDLKATLKGLLIRSVKRYPIIFGHLRTTLNETQWWNTKDLEKLQLFLLNRIVSHAYRTVPYYNSVMRNCCLIPDAIRSVQDLQKLPIISKKNIKEMGNGFISRTSPKMILHTAYTGGTTSERLALKRDLKSICYEHAFVRRQFDWAGIHLLDRCAYLTGRVIAAYNELPRRPFIYDAAMKELILSTFHLSAETAVTYAEALKTYKVKALVAYPSAAYILARVCLEEGIHLSLKCVLTTSETLDQAKSKIISEAFNCKVFDFYGASERVCYIHTCEYGSYHIIPEYGITELSPADPPHNDCYRIIGTGFWNMAMPLIRYDTGDLVQLNGRGCECGRAFPVVTRIVGRDGNFLTTPSGRTLGATALERIMEDVLFAIRKMPVLQGRIIQVHANSMTLEYIPLKSFSKKDAYKLRILVAKHLPADFEVNIQPVKSINRTVTGKVVSLVLSKNQ